MTPPAVTPALEASRPLQIVPGLNLTMGNMRMRRTRANHQLFLVFPVATMEATACVFTATSVGIGPMDVLCVLDSNYTGVDQNFVHFCLQPHLSNSCMHFGLT